MRCPPGAIERAHANALRAIGPSAPTATDGLVALYVFTERSGGTVADSSPRPPVPLTIPTRVGNIRPFLSRDSQLLSWPHTPYAIFDAVINLVIFVPVGLLGCIVLDARGWEFVKALMTTIAATAALSLIAESTQYFLGSRSSELQDLVLNVVSGGLGAAMYWVVRRPSEAV
jgi:VanZ family protein